MERSFKAEIELLRLGDGQTFHGEGILAVTKALLQSGVSYIGGYQGAPVSHMMDVLSDGRIWLKKSLDEDERGELACLFTGLMLYVPPPEEVETK